MKESRSTNNKQSKQGMSHKPMPEIRDNLDSRSTSQQNTKGNDGAGNKQQPKGEKSKKKE